MTDRKSKVIQLVSEIKNEKSRLIQYSMYSLTAFPLVDFGLRHDVHSIGVIWDKVVLLILLVNAGLRYWYGFRPTKPSWQRFAVYFFLYGLDWRCMTQTNGGNGPIGWGSFRV